MLLSVLTSPVLTRLQDYPQWLIVNPPTGDKDPYIFTDTQLAIGGFRVWSAGTSAVQESNTLDGSRANHEPPRSYSLSAPLSLYRPLHTPLLHISESMGFRRRIVMYKSNDRELCVISDPRGIQYGT